MRRWRQKKAVHGEEAAKGAEGENAVEEVETEDGKGRRGKGSGKVGGSSSQYKERRPRRWKW